MANPDENKLLITVSDQEVTFFLYFNCTNFLTPCKYNVRKLFFIIGYENPVPDF